MIIFPDLCQSKTACFTTKQLTPEISLKPPHLLCDRALRHVQFFRRKSKIQMPGSGIKHPQRI
jgi:hypothetical protein